MSLPADEGDLEAALRDLAREALACEVTAVEALRAALHAAMHAARAIDLAVFARLREGR